MSTKQLIRDVISEQVESIIAGSGILGEFVYEVSLSLIHPQQQGIQILPNLQIMLAEKHPVELGRYLSVMTTLPGPFPEPGHLDVAVLGLLNGLGEARQAATAEASSLLTP